MDRWQYLLVLGSCLLVTAPLEIFGAGVYRQLRRTALAILPVAAVFIVWDAIAIAADIWTYNPQFVSGIELPFEFPVEELLFFLVVPLCGLLTYNAVSTILGVLQRFRARTNEVKR